MPEDPSLSVGMRAECSTDSISRPCDIVEKRTNQFGTTTHYYVHYVGCNRRLDEWVPADRVLAINPSLAPGAPRAESSIHVQPQQRATRNMKRRIDNINAVHMSANHYDEALEKEHEESTKMKNIHVVQIGRFELDTWYFSPYPEEFANLRKLYICEYSLKYMKGHSAYERHCAAETARNPPGREIYRCTAPLLNSDLLAAGLEQPSALTIWEVDGTKAQLYSQCLCLLAKLFLDHKTLCYDVEPFLFYVLCEILDDGGHHIVGYFSKEKRSQENNNLACILVLPQHQKKGYSKLLIDTAYQLSIREGEVGSPEKPLSDLGELSFRSYWTQVLLRTLATHRGKLTVSELSTMTAIASEDVVYTLQSLNLVRYWKGQHIISISPKILDDYLKMNSRPSLLCEPEKLVWQPNEEVTSK